MASEDEGNIAFFPMTIGDHVTVGSSSVVCAAHIGLKAGPRCEFNMAKAGKSSFMKVLD